ncbi:hypothetical protein Golob_009102 [Gossypium lobatum]|uniref:Uncharacterized protein n=1 Tax=Gossypium lobatum TaxID=34289 RepID=A0A7J8MHD4_9ROSI|nr:hypothetical protein [Gossypium lobatum]
MRTKQNSQVWYLWLLEAKWKRFLRLNLHILIELAISTASYTWWTGKKRKIEL